ncbi:MAG: hypothetical protein ACOYVJ_07815 [Nitrospirota bacterium]
MSKIFWLEDEKNSFESFSFPLKNKHEITRVEDYEEADRQLSIQEFDLIIVDIIIPSGQKNATLSDLLKHSDRYYGLEFIKKLREKGNKTPILVLTVVSDRATLDSIKEVDHDIEILWKYDSDANTVAQMIENMLSLSKT